MVEDSHELDRLSPAEARGSPGHQSIDGEYSVSKTEKEYGIPSKVTVMSLMDAGAVTVSLTALVSYSNSYQLLRHFSLYTANFIKALAVLIIYDKSIATSLGFTYQLAVFGLLLSIQGFCTSRQVLLSAIFRLVRVGQATIQDLEALLRNSIFTKKATWWVLATLIALAGLGPLLSVLYKPFFVGSTLSVIPGITGQYGIIPPPQLDNLNGNGIALAVNAMTPFWQNRTEHSVHDKVYGENMLVIDEQSTAMLDTPMLQNFRNLRGLLSSDFRRNQSLQLSANVNATIATKVDIPPEERDLLTESFDRVPCEVSNLSWCAGLGGGWWAGMILGGDDSPKLPPSASPTVNYLGVWQWPNRPGGEKFSEVAQKFVLTRQQAHGIWHIDRSKVRLRSAYVINNSSEGVSQDPIATRPLSLDLFGQLLQEYNYRVYDYDFTKSPPSFMASIVWARLATLTIEDRDHLNSWYASVNYTKPGDEYTLQLEAQTVTRSIWLVLIFVVHPLIVITATIVKACLHKVPVSDGVGIISLLSSAVPDSLAMLGGAGYSGELEKTLRVRFSIDDTASSDKARGKISMRVSGSCELGKDDSVQSDEVETRQKYK